ncbi:phosphoribosyltransferase [Deinococcus koreensis]|uniref:Phosphoribosyl transferase n=1 Tax=Deinococcus koreensis TaxID=2054903 RepID=A0A2K3V1Q9_9DEIO|nr:phosphoribosyltransferase family protein [Deinococcus koreensis]PNY82714.1 phosphoribosyl transferase [Deinococcus koreensis]
MSGRFADRAQAGERLAEVVLGRGAWEGTTVLALPRGGVPVAAPVARALQAPLDVLVVRKLGLPGHEELALGAIGPGGARALNDDLIRRLGISPEVLRAVETREEAELQRREARYRAGRSPLNLSGRTALLVDDGLATGATMRAAILAARHLGAAGVVVAVPVGAPDTVEELQQLADDVICVLTPEHLTAVGLYYRDFSQTSDEAVEAALAAAAGPGA